MQALGCLRRPPPRLGLLRAPSGVSSFRRKACSAAQASPPQQHPLSRPKLLLGIESSCDDTGAAVVTSEGRVLGEDIAGQADIHAPWGGVVPNLAMEAHKAAIDRVVENALARAGVQASQLDAVAVTVGPGLSLCLRVGVVKAMALSATHRLPLVRVHHMEAHALVARLQDAYQPARPTPSTLIPTLTDHSPEASSSEPPLPGSQSDHSSNGSSGGSQGADVRTGVVPGVESHSNEYSSSNSSMSSSEGQCAGGSAISSSVPFPFLCLLVSGGHNLVVLVQGVGQYVQLGTTVDDALGEAFDKVARLLSLDLKPSGGAALERLAKEGDPNQFKCVDLHKLHQPIKIACLCDVPVP
uniref:N(6)-L-threonylcarbamoyladenine synthase n=1 Tax=Dunaliella tertiolecta TaxID=3047 RepID=A0A7S3QQA2_DUNTE